MPKPKVEPKPGQRIKKTSITVDVKTWKASQKKAAEHGFEHSWSAYIVSLIKKDVKEAKHGPRSSHGDCDEPPINSPKSDQPSSPLDISSQSDALQGGKLADAERLRAGGVRRLRGKRRPPKGAPGSAH